MQHISEFITVWLLHISVTEVSSLCTAGRPVGSSEDWDHLVFAQQYPPSVCIDSKLRLNHQCVIPRNVTGWSVHGVWPSRGSTEGPAYCDTKATFNSNQLQGILPSLIQHWPNLYTDTLMYSFWEHEWCKHGTCAKSVSTMSNELKYFTAGICLNSKYNLYSILSSSGITPSNTRQYELQAVIEALEKHTAKKSVKVSCAIDKVKKMQYLMQISICLDKTSFRAIECPTDHSFDVPTVLTAQHSGVFTMEQLGQVSEPESCTAEKYVSYPPQTHRVPSMTSNDGHLHAACSLLGI